jgi:hypothetical protein
MSRPSLFFCDYVRILLSIICDNGALLGELVTYVEADLEFQPS